MNIDSLSAEQFLGNHHWTPRRAVESTGRGRSVSSVAAAFLNERLVPEMLAVASFITLLQFVGAH